MLEHDVKKQITELINHYSCNQRELAEMLKTSPSNITRWLNNIQKPTLQQSLKITNLYTKTFQLSFDI